MKVPSILTILLILFTATIADAHGVRAESVSTNKVRFSYDDNSPLTRSRITVYDVTGKEIAKGTVDTNGVFDYSAYKAAATIVAEDVFGHRGEYNVGEKASPHTNLGVIVGVVGALLVVAAAFHLRNKRRR